MASFNSVVVLGNVTRDSELRHLQNNTAVTDLGLAVNERRKNAAGDWVEEAVFLDITVFGKTAEFVSQFCGKGSQVLVAGRLKMDTWQDKNSGEKRSKLKIIAETVQLLGGKGDRKESTPKQEKSVETKPIAEEEAPF